MGSNLPSGAGQLVHGRDASRGFGGHARGVQDEAGPCELCRGAWVALVVGLPAPANKEARASVQEEAHQSTGRPGQARRLLRAASGWRTRRGEDSFECLKSIMGPAYAKAVQDERQIPPPFYIKGPFHAIHARPELAVGQLCNCITGQIL